MALGYRVEFGLERFILCEGPHDKSFLETLIKERKLGSFQVETAYECVGKGGCEGFGPALEGFEAVTGLEQLKGILIMTDNDNKQTFPKLLKQLVKAGYNPTKSPFLGEILGKPLVIVLVPDDKTYGDLEKLCLPALYSKWPKARECVEAYLKCTGAEKWSGKRDQQLNKAKVRSIIAGYYDADPYKGLGYLFKDNKSLARHKCFDRLADILGRFDQIIQNGKL